jgi:hypothetical protein
MTACPSMGSPGAGLKALLAVDPDAPPLDDDEKSSDTDATKTSS